MFRCHGAEHGPLWFANAGYGRFDLADTQGTCYTAESEQITLLETWGGMRLIPGAAGGAESVPLRIRGLFAGRQPRVAQCQFPKPMHGCQRSLRGECR